MRTLNTNEIQQISGANLTDALTVLPSTCVYTGLLLTAAIATSPFAALKGASVAFTPFLNIANHFGVALHHGLKPLYVAYNK